MESEKRLILAIALSLLVVLVYQSYARKFYKPYHVPAVSAKSQIVGEKAQPASAMPPDAQSSYQKETEVLVKEETVTVENELYRAVLTNVGGGIKELYLLHYKEKNGQPTLISKANGWGPVSLATYDATEGQATVGWKQIENSSDTVAYEQEGPAKKITKKLIFHNNNYIIELELSVQNKTDIAQVSELKIIGGQLCYPDNAIEKRYVEADARVGDKVYKRTPASKSIAGGEIFNGSPAWVSSKGRYFSLILKPEQLEAGAFIESADRKNIWSGIISGPHTLKPQQNIVSRYILYAGPNSPDRVAELGAGATESISYGALNGVATIISKALNWFYKLIGNYGVAIILLTIAISVLLYPLTRKSLSSMKEMQKIQPEIEKIKKECANNPQKLNKETMELYKRHKINPLGGCLPMLLQFPVFISLYQVLTRSVELKGASFLWIKDLSEPDAIYTLKFSIPMIGNYINILPILMAISTFAQQKMSMPGGDASEQQRIMSKIMPVFLGVIFYNMPSGFVLYWLTNTIVMLLIQELILKSRQPA